MGITSLTLSFFRRASCPISRPILQPLFPHLGPRPSLQVTKLAFNPAFLPLLPPHPACPSDPRTEEKVSSLSLPSLPPSAAIAIGRVDLLARPLALTWPAWATGPLTTRRPLPIGLSLREAGTRDGDPARRKPTSRAYSITPAEESAIRVPETVPSLRGYSRLNFNRGCGVQMWGFQAM